MLFAYIKNNFIEIYIEFLLHNVDNVHCKQFDLMLKQIC